MNESLRPNLAACYRAMVLAPRPTRACHRPWLSKRYFISTPSRSIESSRAQRETLSPSIALGPDDAYLPFDQVKSIASTSSHGSHWPSSSSSQRARHSATSSPPGEEMTTWFEPEIELPDHLQAVVTTMTRDNADPFAVSGGRQRRSKPEERRSPNTRTAGRKVQDTQSKPRAVPYGTMLDTPQEKEQWQIQKAALQDKFGESGWQPRKRLSPDALEGIRALHGQYPDRFTTPVLAEQFKVSVEAIRRILKSKWRPSGDEEEDRLKRWDKRGEKIWSALVDQGVHAPKRWREMGIGTGPRRAAQDRSLQKIEALKAAAKTQREMAEKRDWSDSLASRI